MREKTGLLRRLAARICIPAAVAVSALALAMPASAAPSATAASSAAAAPPVTGAPFDVAAQLPAALLKGPLPAAYYRGVTLRTTTVSASASRAVRARMGAAANQACRTITTTVWYNNTLGMTLWWWYMHTFFCWDGVTVTNHVTSEDINIPGWAAAGGWGYKGLTNPDEFNCWYKTSRWCSANHEHSQAQFDLCILRIGCIESVYPWGDQNEYYNGTFDGNGGT